MTSRFVALPVDRGDAFLLDREEKTVLVDGGAETVMNFVSMG